MIIAFEKWDILSFEAIPGRQGENQVPEYDYDELGLSFPNDSTEHMSLFARIPPTWKSGSPIKPRLLYVQTSASDTSVWKMKDRAYNPGGSIPAWAYISSVSSVTEYTSGSILQVVRFPDIDQPGLIPGAMMDVIIYRSSSDGTANNLLLKQFDLQYLANKIGSANAQP